MRQLRDAYLDDPRSLALGRALAEGRDAVLGACHGGLFAVLLAATLKPLQDGARAAGRRLPPIIAPDPAQLQADLEELGLLAAVLPEIDHFIDETADGDRSGHARRSAALEAWTNGAILVASPAAAEQPVPDLGHLAAASIRIRNGDETGLNRLVDRLVEAGYRVAPEVEARGSLAVRGGIVDVFPWVGEHPYRLEFFGDTVDAIRSFDPLSQESIARCDEAVLASTAGLLAQAPLWPQLPPGPIIVLGDLPLRGRLKADHGHPELRLARGLEAGAIDGAATGVERLRGDLQRGLIELGRLSAEAGGSKVLLLARNDEARRELAEHARDAGLDAEARVGRLSAGWRDLERGLVVVHDFELAARAPVRRRASKVAGGSPLDSASDLKRNDLVVHLKHGIGVFRGLASLERRGFLEDFLLLEFAGGTKLYVPVDAIDLVQKYVGAGGRRPELSAIGGAAWAKKRAKAEKAIADISAELLQTQVARIAAGGIAYPEDSARQRRFEAGFGHEETEDQLAAVREIKTDMQKPVAMDRLLCGDVGFGKTEVALRAAFKAADAGWQVAVLAPTTLLAEQHLETFQERMEPFGIRVAGLDRFREPKERAKVKVGVAAGEVQVLVGTHAMLAGSVSFAKLGLLIIDEEHRFGVKHKERLRALREGCRQPPDVLTLSATPIPRTLHFSLVGLRDISVLSEAPAERMAVETRVGPWEDEVVRHALEREREREGQAFIVHHRAEELDVLVHRVHQLVPGLRCDSVHGRMDEERIAGVMEAFRHHRLDVLVSTSIVESGLDIPNANTLIVSNAHCFGLAELHQLRGRIGRFSRQAYGFFLTPPGRELGEEARERLSAIQEYAELGAGFKLAMRDLELRGAGNLLGSEQSGHIDAIGYELYTRMLADAVARSRSAAGDHAKAAPAASHDDAPDLLAIHLDAYIPDDWLEAPQLKFELHKRLDACRRLGDLEAIGRQARDRYGALPDPVLRLFRARAIRLRARELGINRIEVADRQLRLRLDGAIPAALASARLPELVHVQPDKGVLVLFFRPQLSQDIALDVLCRLLGLDLGWLGKGF